MSTDGWAKLVAYIGCAWAVFSAPPANLPQAIIGCSAMIFEPDDQ